MALCLAGFATRKDLVGVTSIVRALGLAPACYDRLPDFFHSPALNLNQLTRAWSALVFRAHPAILRVNGRPVLAGDGIQVAKAGRKMPGVKKLHRQSESNTKPEFIFGHSCQAVTVLTQALSSVFALPLACRIHEGSVFSNRDHRTLLDKMILLIDSLAIQEPFYFVADAYYATGNIVRGLLAHDNHLVTRVKSNSVAFFPAAPPPPNRPRPKGRPAKYGKKIQVAALLKQTGQFQKAPSPVYGERGVILKFRAADLLWRPVGILVSFVVVLHPQRGAILLMCTDLMLSPLDIIRIYGLRFKIEVSFKQALHVIGAYAHHFWMAAMTPLRRVTGNQYLHRTSEVYRNAVRRKIAAYHRHIQLGLIARTCFRSSHGALDKVHHLRRRPPVALLAQPLFEVFFETVGGLQIVRQRADFAPRSRAGPSFGSTAQPPRLARTMPPARGAMAKPALRRVSRRSAKLGFLRCCRRKNIYPNIVGWRGADSSSAASPRIPRDVLWIPTGAESAPA